MLFETIGMLGTGNMGSAVAKAIRTGAPELPLLLANRSPEKPAALAEALGNAGVCSNCEAAQRSTLLFLAVKPQVMPAVLEEIAPVLAARKDRFVLVTMAAGLTCKTIQKLAGGAYPVIRIMPNTPAAIGKGVIPYCGELVTEQELADFAALLQPAGLLDPLPEHLIDAASAVSGCGPAFVYLFIEALADGGVACGLPRDKALRYAAQMTAGAAELVLASGKHPGALKDAVCSPGGTTIQGVYALERDGFRGAAIDAVTAAYEKTLTLK